MFSKHPYQDAGISQGRQPIEKLEARMCIGEFISGHCEYSFPRSSDAITKEWFGVTRWMDANNRTDPGLQLDRILRALQIFVSAMKAMNGIGIDNMVSTIIGSSQWIE